MDDLTRAPVRPASQWNLGPALLAWLLPGVGHWLLGERPRGAVLSASIGSLWLAGLLIGGIGVIDSHTHRAWFLGQMLVAPSIAVNWTAQKMSAGQLREDAADYPALRPSHGRVKEQGILYTALAGLLNLLAMIDVVNRPARLGQESEHPSHPRK